MSKLNNIVTISDVVLNTMSAKGRGYLEAALKYAEGHRLIEEAQLEMAHLDGLKAKKGKGKGKGRYASSPGGKISKPKKLKAKKASPSKVTVEDFLKILKKGPMSTGALERAGKCSASHVRNLFTGLKDVKRVGAGNRVQWALKSYEVTDERTLSRRSTVANKTTKRSPKTRQQANCEPANTEQFEKDKDKIVELLKETPGLTIGPLMKKLKRSFYPVERAIKSLIKTDRLKPAKGTAENGRPLQTWEPT